MRPGPLLVPQHDDDTGQMRGTNALSSSALKHTLRCGSAAVPGRRFPHIRHLLGLPPAQPPSVASPIPPSCPPAASSTRLTTLHVNLYPHSLRTPLPLIAQRTCRVGPPARSQPQTPAEVRSTRASSQHAEFLASAKRSELQQLLEEERLARAEATLRHKEQAEAARRGMQVSRGMGENKVLVAGWGIWELGSEGVGRRCGTGSRRMRRDVAGRAGAGVGEGAGEGQEREARGARRGAGAGRVSTAAAQRADGCSTTGHATAGGERGSGQRMGAGGWRKGAAAFRQGCCR